jgi:hypothetical protein
VVGRLHLRQLDQRDAQAPDIHLRKSRQNSLIHNVLMCLFFKFANKKWLFFFFKNLRNIFVAKASLVFFYALNLMYTGTTDRISGKSNPVSGRMPDIKKGRIIQPDIRWIPNFNSETSHLHFKDC